MWRPTSWTSMATSWGAGWRWSSGSDSATRSGSTYRRTWPGRSSTTSSAPGRSSRRAGVAEAPRPRRGNLPGRALVLLIVCLLVAGVIAVVWMTRRGSEPSPRRPAALHRTTGALGPASPSPPAARPSAAPGRRGPLLIHGGGDVSLDPGFISTYRTHGYGYAWSGLNGLFRRDDLTVVNLECAVSDLGSPVPKRFNFRGNPAALPAMRRAGVEVANMGNNHSYDYGPAALLDTRRNLIENDIAPVGAGKDPTEANRPAVF